MKISMEYFYSYTCIDWYTFLIEILDQICQFSSISSMEYIKFRDSRTDHYFSPKHVLLEIISFNAQKHCTNE